MYLNAIMDAEDLGIVSKDGWWGADYRIDRIVSWMQTMQLSPDNVPYMVYGEGTGVPVFGVRDENNTNIYDYGALLIALNRLKEYRPDLTSTVDSLVNTRMNTSFLASQMLYDFPYEFYVAHGFKYFGYDTYPQVFKALNVLKDMDSGPKVTVYGVQLPKVFTDCEPLLLGTFGLAADPGQSDLTRKVYLAHEGRFNATGKFTAMSEGNTGLDSPTYVYEWTVASSGAPWVVDPSPVTPIVYFKVAVSFLAIYNTDFARNMVAYYEPRLRTSGNGYMDGIDEDGRKVTIITDKTNGMILNAAKFVLKPPPSSSPSPTPAPNSPSPSPATSSTPVPTVTPSLTPSPTIYNSSAPTTWPDSTPAATASPQVTPAPSTGTTAESSPSLTPGPSSNSSPSAGSLSSSPSLSASPSTNSSPVAGSPSGWLDGSWMVVLVVVGACLFLPLLVVFRLRRNHQQGFDKHEM